MARRQLPAPIGVDIFDSSQQVGLQSGKLPLLTEQQGQAKRSTGRIAFHGWVAPIWAARLERYCAWDSNAVERTSSVNCGAAPCTDATDAARAALRASDGTWALPRSVEPRLAGWARTR